MAMSRPFGGRRFTSFPSKATVPDETDSSPAIIRSVVVFPHPDGPTRTMNSPSSMARSMPRTAGTSPKFLVRLRSSIAAIE